jgi:hypothetical protein
LIAHGDVIVKDVTENESPNVLTIKICPPNGGGALARVAASKAKARLLLPDQMMRLNFKLSGETKDAKFDFIEVQLGVCKTPITEKKIKLTASKVLVPVQNQE